MKKSFTSIVLRVGPPTSKDQKGLYGQAFEDKSGVIYQVWIDDKQSLWDFADTFFHEMTHVFLWLVKLRQELPEKTEHKVCNWIGYHAKVIVAQYFRNKKG